MNNFDFIDVSAKAYRFVWAQRVILLTMALVPFAVKLSNYVLLEAFGLGDNPLRQGLLLMPAYFAEGWLVARLIRFAVQGEMIEEHLSGNPQIDFQRFEGHLRSVMSSMIVFVLIKLVLALFVGLFMHEQGRLAEAMPADTPDYTTASVFTGFVILGILIYLFRFLWLYVPLALGYDMQDFLYRIRQYAYSFYFLAAYIVCFVPVAFVMTGCLNIIISVTGGTDNVGYTYGSIFIQSSADMFLVVLSSVAIAFGVQSLYTGTGDKK